MEIRKQGRASMLNLIKPGYVLRFGVDPSTIISPPVALEGDQDNAATTPWTAGNSLGVVTCLSHVTGPLEPMCAAVARQVRVGGSPVSRAVSYSGVGNLARTAGSRRDVHVGQANADFVGYVDGKSMFINSSNMVLSKDFSGCLMVAYTLASQRRVAHVAASHSPKWDCKQVFLNTLRKNGGSLLGWFRPYEEVYDVNAKLATYQVISTYIGGNINKLITFGAIDAADQGYAIDAFKPVGVAGNDWVVTRARLKQMSSAWNV